MGRYIAYIGKGTGGIELFEISPDGRAITPLPGGTGKVPAYAGYLAWAREKAMLYAVDERKTAGRGDPNPTCVHAYRADRTTGALTFCNAQPTIGCFAAAVCVGPGEEFVFTANHGWFDRVIKAVETADGRWVNQFVYDDSTVVQYPVSAEGALEPACDCFTLTGQGMDPNGHHQAAGHAQASPHAHIVVVDPSGQFLLVCDKGTEKLYTFRLGGRKLTLASVYQLPLLSGPRHCAFDDRGRLFVTCEFSSELWCLDFDREQGSLRFRSKCSTLSPDYLGPNEPATLQVDCLHHRVFVNNRGEDTIVCIDAAEDGTLTRLSSTKAGGGMGGSVKESIRDLQLLPGGEVLLVPVRPEDVLRSYAIGPDGSLTPITEYPVSHPVHICLVEMG